MYAHACVHVCVHTCVCVCTLCTSGHSSAVYSHQFATCSLSLPDAYLPDGCEGRGVLQLPQLR